MDRSKLILTKPSEEDVGIYSVEVPNTDGVSASHTLTKEGRKHVVFTSTMSQRIEGVCLNDNVSPIHKTGDKYLINGGPTTGTPTVQVNGDLVFPCLNEGLLEITEYSIWPSLIVP